MSDEETSLVPTPEVEVATLTGVDQLLARIRPEWQAKPLIRRVKKLLPVDPGSACQRLLNAAIYDLRKKIVVAGLDLAKHAANAHKMPPVTKPEDILESYSTTSVLNLAYRMGILSRPEWRRLDRVYELRRDLEHEDYEYEAESAECVLVFTHCIEIVLSREPVELLRVEDIKDLIQQPDNVTPSPEVLDDFGEAPDPRQVDIAQFLIRTALDDSESDVVRQNAVETLRRVRPFLRNSVKLDLASDFQLRLKRNPLSVTQGKVAAAAGFLPYLKRRHLRQFFDDYATKLLTISHAWEHHSSHGSILNEFEDVGGLVMCPPCEARERIVRWCILCFIGEPGNRGHYGRNRAVFYSDVGASKIRRLFEAAGAHIKKDVQAAGETKKVKSAISPKPALARRYEKLLDIVEKDE